MYVTEQYYGATYGGTMPASEFPSCERKAEAYIRSITYLRGNIFAEDSDTVRDAVCAAADIFYRHSISADKLAEKGAPGPVKLENNDGYSVTYVTEQTDGQTVEDVLRKKLYDAVYPYLLPSGWLSRKVRCGHADKCGYHTL